MRPSLEEHLGSRDVARIIYGSIIGLALVVALQAHPPAAAKTAGALVGTAIAVGLAEVYAELVGIEARTRRPIRFANLREVAGDALSVAFGAAFPAVFFVLAAIGVIERGTAYTLAKWSGVGLICLYGFLAARLAGARMSRAIIQAVLVGLIGVGVVSLKSLTH